MSNKDFFEAVNYEYKMLQFSYSKLCSRLTIEERNCYLECFLLHSKVLLEFLMEKGSNGRKSCEFLTSNKKEWKKERNALLSENKRNKLFKKFNNLLSHTGIKRVKLAQEDKEWDIRYLFKTIKSLLEKYSLGLEDLNKPSDWLMNIQSTKQRHSNLMSQTTSDITITSIIGHSK